MKRNEDFVELAWDIKGNKLSSAMNWIQGMDHPGNHIDVSFDGSVKRDIQKGTYFWLVAKRNGESPREIIWRKVIDPNPQLFFLHWTLLKT